MLTSCCARRMDIEDESDVQRIFQRMELQGYVDFDAILQETESAKVREASRATYFTLPFPR